MSGTANPSAHQQVRRAVVDEIKELKNNVSELQESIAKLEELDSSNKRLHTKVTRLESELKDIKSTHQNLLDFKTQATKLLTALVSSRGVDEVRNQILSSALASDDPNAYLKALVDVDPEEGNGRTEAAQSANDGPRTAGQGVSMPQNEAESLQEELRDSQELKDACNDSLFHLYGAIRHLKLESMEYPHGLTRNDPEWPSEGIGAQRRPYLRFDFTKRYSDPINEESFKEWCKFVRNRGPERVPAAAAAIAQATDATIQARCIMKYEYEAEKYRKYLKGKANPPSDTRDDAEGDVSDGSTVQPAPNLSPRKKLATAYYRSRADAKLKARARKLDKMVNSPYSEMQKRTFLTHGAQSADEDEWVVGEDGVRRKTKNFITRPWPFLSEEFKAMKTAVDAIEDPEPPRGYQLRVPGPDREGLPPRNKCNQYCLRKWMIKPEVLSQHPEWIRLGRVIPDDEPVESARPSTKRKRTAGQPSTSTVSDAKKARLDLNAAKEKFTTTLAGETLEQLGEALNLGADDVGDGYEGGDDSQEEWPASGNEEVSL